MARLIAKIAVSAATYWVDRPYDYLVPPEMADSVAVGKRVTVPFARGNRRSEGIILALRSESAYDKLKCIDSVLDEEPVLSEELVKLALWMRERYFCTVYEAAKAMLPVGLWFTTRSLYTIAEGYDKDLAYEAAGRSRKEQRVLDVLFANGGECELKALEIAFGEEDPAPAVRSLLKKGVLHTDEEEKRRIRDKTVRFASLAVDAAEAMELAGKKRARAPQQAAILELLCCVEQVAVREICYFTGASAASVKALEKAGLIALTEEEVYRRPNYKTGERQPLPELNASQSHAFDGLKQLTTDNEAGCALLFGVTGSGKTAVYVRLIEEVLRQGRSAIMMVPEIALTPQMLTTFSSYFGDKIAVIHSSLSVGERYDEWKRIRCGEATVVIGTRSAVFAPVPSLGLVIMDEEQEDTYKSENTPRYHARDVAKYRCHQHGALLLLGSATPDIESMYHAKRGHYAYFELPDRFNRKELPDVRIVDMKRELRKGNGGCISSVLREELQKNIERGEQSILFLNRRGANRLITCPECGYIYTCPNCSVSLTYHSANKRLMCHYCGHSQRLEGACPDCGGALSHVGAGTQKVAEELTELFPDVQVLRMDTDTVAPVGSHEVLLSRFREEKIPILVGTQMVTKGLNFELVTLVGVISADQALYSGDYRAAERTFSGITQVVGRAGRGDRAGRAIIQTFTPENQTITMAARQDYPGFYANEIGMRGVQNAPPFAEILSITASGESESAVLRACAAVRGILSRELQGSAARILGPAPMSVLRVNNRFRYRVTVATAPDKQVRRVISNILTYCNSDAAFRGVSVYADVNPSDQ